MDANMGMYRRTSAKKFACIRVHLRLMMNLKGLKKLVGGGESNREDLQKPHESRPWNPIKASVFYCAGIIEKWGMGTLKILEWCKEGHTLPPDKY
jgi:hypothetical protein